MGKSFISINKNNLNLENVYKRLFSKTWEITEASDEKFFRRIPELSEVKDIGVGCDGTKESVLKLKDGGFCTINKTIRI